VGEHKRIEMLIEQGSLVRLAALSAICLVASGCRFGYDASVSSDAAVDGPFLDDPPLARWRLNEASSGQDVTTLIDDTDDPVNLNLEYVVDSPVWGEALGGRYLEFSLPNNDDTGGASAVASGTKLDQIHGRRSGTIETKHEWFSCGDTDPRIVEITDGTIPADNAWFSIREDGGRELFAVRFAGRTDWSAYSYLMSGGCLTDGPHVIHWVVDTEDDNPDDWIRGYVDGVRVDIELVGGVPVRSNDTIDLGRGERRVTIGRPHNGERSQDGRLWYAAFYPRALPADAIARQAEALAVGDDVASAE